MYLYANASFLLDYLQLEPVRVILNKIDIISDLSQTNKGPLANQMTEVINEYIERRAIYFNEFCITNDFYSSIICALLNKMYLPPLPVKYNNYAIEMDNSTYAKLVCTFLMKEVASMIPIHLIDFKFMTIEQLQGRIQQLYTSNNPVLSDTPIVNNNPNNRDHLIVKFTVLTYLVKLDLYSQLYMLMMSINIKSLLLPILNRFGLDLPVELTKSFIKLSKTTNSHDLISKGYIFYHNTLYTTPINYLVGFIKQYNHYCNKYISLKFQLFANQYNPSIEAILSTPLDINCTPIRTDTTIVDKSSVLALWKVVNLGFLSLDDFTSLLDKFIVFDIHFINLYTCTTKQQCIHSKKLLNYA